ncbi:hypothetical protein EPD83_019520, partial [Phycicoccus sp. CMS6Z-2]|nr:hypothetical protein [Phycicoccus flavus]
MADDLLPTADPAGLLERAVAARVGQAAPVLRDWYRPAALRAQLAGHLGDEVDRVADAGFGAGLREAIGPRAAGSARVTDPLAWANRVLGLPGGGWALTGIRFRGMDPGRPFVDVVATDAAPDP